MASIRPFLMFEGSAEQAMQMYVGLFPNSGIKHIERYGPGGPGPEGTVKRADFTVAGQDLICIDSPIKHAFAFTPSFSLFVECESDADFSAAFDKLSAGGTVLMPPRQLRVQHEIRLAQRPLRSFVATQPAMSHRSNVAGE